MHENIRSREYITYLWRAEYLFRQTMQPSWVAASARKRPKTAIIAEE